MEHTITLSQDHLIDLGAILRAELHSRELKMNHFATAFPDRKPREIEKTEQVVAREIDALKTLLDQIGQA